MFQYQMLFVANFLLTVILMKIVSWLVAANNENCTFWRFVLCSPYPSVRSERYGTPIRHYSVAVTLGLHVMLMSIFLVIGYEFLTPLNYFRTILIAPAIYFFTEALGALGQLVFSWRRQAIFPIHHHPMTSPSLSQFWGRRWNLWVQDWLRDISAAMGKRNRIVRIVSTFLVSGLFHEMMVNLPYWLLTGKSYFGTMMAYFVIQALGVYVDKKYMKHSGKITRLIFQWLVVVLPSPLFVNVPILSFFGVT